MVNVFQESIGWLLKSRLVSVIAVVAALWGCSNLYFFGFRLGIPYALRPFLDSSFFYSLAFDFFVAVAVAAVFSRIGVLLIRLVLSNFPVRTVHIINQINESLLGVIDLEVFGKILDRQANTQLRLASRWVRRKNIAVSLTLSLILFSLLFLGKQAFWFVPVCLIAAPIFWVLVSKVELRREFATPSNTVSFSKNRVLRALVSFVVIYLGFCVFVSGIASFQHKLETKVSVAVYSKQRNSSIVAVTSSGILVADRQPNVAWPKRMFSVSGYFIPYDRLDSVGQKH